MASDTRTFAGRDGGVRKAIPRWRRAGACIVLPDGSIGAVPGDGRGWSAHRFAMTYADRPRRRDKIGPHSATRSGESKRQQLVQRLIQTVASLGLLAAVGHASAAIDGVLSWLNNSHVPASDRIPIVPMNAESFAVLPERRAAIVYNVIGP